MGHHRRHDQGWPLWNAVTRTLWGAAEFSIGRALSDLVFYIVLGRVAIVLQALLRPLVERRESPWWKLPLIFLEGLWVFSVFFIVLLSLRAIQTWLVGRAFWRQILHSWQGFLDWLPEIPLPLVATLPKALQDFSIWLTENFLPGLWQGIALPLVWVAVVAIVFGWRDIRFRGLFKDSERDVPGGDDDSGTVRIVTLLTAELQEKWLPLLLSFRLIWRSGPHVLGAYLILSALLYILDRLLCVLLQRMLSSGTIEQVVLRSFNLIGVIHHLGIMSLSVCLYAATFTRALAAAAGLSREAAEDPHDTPGGWRPSGPARRGQAVKLQ